MSVRQRQLGGGANGRLDREPDPVLMAADRVHPGSMSHVLARVGGASLAAMLIVGCAHSGPRPGSSAPVQFPAPTNTTKAQTPTRSRPAVHPLPVHPRNRSRRRWSRPTGCALSLVPPDVSGPIVGSPLGFEKLFNQPAPASIWVTARRARCCSARGSRLRPRVDRLQRRATEERRRKRRPCGRAGRWVLCGPRNRPSRIRRRIPAGTDRLQLGGRQQPSRQQPANHLALRCFQYRRR